MKNEIWVALYNPHQKSVHREPLLQTCQINVRALLSNPLLSSALEWVVIGYGTMKQVDEINSRFLELIDETNSL